LAFEIGLFHGLNIEWDFFKDDKTNILMTRNDLPANMGLLTVESANIGEMVSKGFDATVDYNINLSKEIWLSARGTITYSTNETKVYEEPEYPENLKYLSRVGYNWNTPSGYIAERLFTDDADVNNSPKQPWGKYGPGDIKYHDVNRDGKIDSQDRVKMGYPTSPEMVYGFGCSFGYKDFDLSLFFQGQSMTSFMIDPTAIMPYYSHGNGKINGLLQVIADDHWSESNPDSYAFYPRLSVDQVQNNAQASSWWLRDGAFIRLKTAEIGYEPKGKWVNKKTHLSGLRVYVQGMNLLTFSRFKLWDVEMKGNGLGYPLQRVFNAGVRVSF
jgi:hypothetical protein